MAVKVHWAVFCVYKLLDWAWGSVLAWTASCPKGILENSLYHACTISSGSWSPAHQEMHLYMPSKWKVFMLALQSPLCAYLKSCSFSQILGMELWGWSPVCINLKVTGWPGWENWLMWRGETVLFQSWGMLKCSYCRILLSLIMSRECIFGKVWNHLTLVSCTGFVVLVLGPKQPE